MQYKNLKLLDFVKTALPQLVLSAGVYCFVLSSLAPKNVYLLWSVKLIFTIINQTNSSVTLWNLSCCKVYLQSRRTLSISVPSGH